MKITGIQIREAVKHWTAQKLLLSKVFVDAGFYFPGENKRTPGEVATQYEHASRCAAELEAIQQAYNASQCFVVEGRTITLSEGVKLTAAYSHLVNMWTAYAQRGLIDEPKSYGYSTESIRRSTTEIPAIRSCTTAEANETASQYARKVSYLRSAVATANTAPFEISDDKLPLFICVMAEVG